LLNQIQSGRWDELLRRLFPVKDRTIAPVLASELVGQVVVQNWEPELYVLRGERLAIGTATQTAVAAEFPHTQLFNPAGSGNLLIVDEIWLRSPSNLLYDLAFQDVVTVGFTNVGSSFRDTRLGVASVVGTTVGVLSVDTNVALTGGATVGRYNSEGLRSSVVKPKIILGPGTSLIVRGLTVNTTMSITYLWRERIAEPSELLIG